MKSVWKTRFVAAKSLQEFNVELEHVLNELEENEFRIVKIEDMKITKWDANYQTVIISCKNPAFMLGPAGTTIALS